MRKRIDPVDVQVGARIREARLRAGFSQTVLGNRLGITFQQIQKYEKGANRIAPGRLTVVAASVGLPVSWFFEGTEQKDTAASTVEAAALRSFITSRVGIELNLAFNRISSASRRRDIVRLVSELAGMGDPD